MLTEEDQQKYNDRAMRLVKALDGMDVADGVMQSGQRVINEVIADLGGLQLSLDLAEKEKDFNYDLFFRTLAGKFYRRFMTKEEALDYYSSDPHPAMYIRINFVCA